jgi:hypothetical protein
MHVAMERDERVLFESFVNRSQRVLEFGSGGSTWIAAQKKKAWIISIDSSKEWLEKVANETHQCPTQPELVFADIGPTKEWGFPVDEKYKSKWPAYHELVWQRPGVEEADLFFVDGRFRVACALQCLLRSRKEAVLGIHDFERPYYRLILDFAREVAAANRMSFFLRSNNFDPNAARKALERVKFDPA